MRPGKNGQTDYVHVFLYRRLDYSLRLLVQAGVDDLHPGVAQSAGDNFRAAVVAVQARFGDENSYLFSHNIASLGYLTTSFRQVKT